MYLSIIIPAYNEEQRIKASLEAVYSYLNIQKFEYEVIVVDDGSSDNTKQHAIESLLYQSGRLRLIVNDNNKGKGFSIKRGILESKGELVLFSDADLSTPIQEIEKLIDAVSSGYDIAIASRSMKGACVKVHQPVYREFMGRFFNRIVQAFVLKGIIDTQCGFKLFKSTPAKEIARSMLIDGFSFDVEMLYIARQRGFSIKEVPVVWINSPASKVNFFKDSFNIFKDVLSIKRLHA
jgi:dolichyl-phosphate beta-glucosyltransferase